MQFSGYIRDPAQINYITNCKTMNNTITIGANTSYALTVKRFGFGTMRLTGEHVWGEPTNRTEALQILRTALDKGIRFFDTADYYGDDVTNRLIAEALFPYPEDLVICTKVGAMRKPDKGWYCFDKPENLKASVDNNLKTLKIERLSLVHFRVMPGTATPFEESMAAIFDLQKAGKILHIGVGCVTPDELNKAMTMGDIASVENVFGHGQRTTFVSFGRENRGMQEVMSICTKNNIAMIPYWSLQTSLPKKEGKIDTIANKYNASPAQINLAWLLHYNDLLLPIPGTSRLKHFGENLEAFDISLTAEDMKTLE